ncbi:MAG: class I SAM-dependent RNA methyltransferase [Candidatus Gracilibacteria bacterium]|jgi:putative N6-adenine-specific DNA methylase
MELIATCAFGLEKLVQDELRNLKLWTTKTEDGKVTFEGDELALIRANLWLRCADRVQIKIDEFEATTFDDLFDQIQPIEWEKHIGINDSFPVQATSAKSMLHSEPAIQSIVKKAIVKRLQQKYNLEILPENSGAVYQIMVKANKDQFTISIDSSGESLHKRGYRLKANLAPIKETLAAAMVKLSDWLPAGLPNGIPERSFVDPFCGSGTIAIEAALMASDIAPGLKREFAFQNWPWIDPKKIKEAYDEANEAAAGSEKQTPETNADQADTAKIQDAKSSKKIPIYCFDIDAQALEIAQENAKRAGFTSINFKRADFNDLDFSKFENCTFVTNPPYGDRLEEQAHVIEMYRQFGKKFAQTKNCSLFIITSNENFPLLFGRPADKNRKLFNGNIKCYLFSYFSNPS